MATETQRPEVLGPIDGPRPGTRLGRYELLAQLATGGMAVVWIARQLGQFGFRRNVALKTIRPEYAADLSFRKMFLDEARLASRVRHANVAEVLDLGEEGQVVYQAIELVEGTTLKRLIEARRTRNVGGLPVPIAARVVVDTLRGLHAAHELRDDHGVALCLVHRDVSPHNILVGVDGLAKISDFGIAKAFGRVTDETDAGSIKGKYAYMSPEQLRRAPLDRRSDVFATGVVLWEALTGERLFGGGDVLETAERVLNQPVVDLHVRDRSIPKAVSSVAAKALSRNPDERYPSAEAMADALEEAVRLATGKELAAFVDDPAFAELRIVRHALGEARAVDDAATVVDAPSGERLIVPEEPVRKRWPLAVIPLALVALVLVASTRWRTTTPQIAASPSAVASVPPVTDPSSATPEVAPAASAPTDGPTSRTASSAPSVRRAPPVRGLQRTRATSPTPSSPTPSSPTQDPRFGSPY